MFDYNEAERVIEMAKQKIEANLIIVFGSVAKRTAEKDSDLDIIVVKETNENTFISGAEARLALKGSKIPIDLIVYTPDEFKKELSNRYSLAHEAMNTGRIIYGSV
ncbi:MAG: nucleotidyltransferase domain-containing protein [Methanomassiliicoccaceae archaeon]|nr:nucleotidyltransferase domain-containing protein [Methanomassiliicoccaceae archaeon]